MKIDKALNLVVPVEADEGMVYIHSMPISREVFERYYMVIAKTFSAIFQEGLNVVAGPRVAAMMLKSIAESMGAWSGPTGVELGLMAEIRRLTNVAVPTGNGWTSLPLHDAMQRGYVSQREVDEAEGAIVFFTCVSLMGKKNEAAAWTSGMCELWNTQTTSLMPTEYAISLQTLIETETSPQAAQQSSLPG